jgi:apolipoprotein N-acyltransferase
MKQYFNIYLLKESLIVSIFLSLPLYLIHFGIDFKFLNTIIIIIALFLFYKADIKSYPLIGFFTSIFWLWWIAMSFRYYGLTYLIPFIILGIGIFYGLVFWLLTFLRYKLIIILIFVFGFGYISPFGFNWFRYDVLLPHTYFYNKTPIQPAPLKIKIVTTHTPQNLKWEKEYIYKEIDDNFKNIDEAIKQKYEVVILPETVFPLPLNLYTDLMQILKKLSKKIVIVTGALSYQNKTYYNSTYVFKNGKYKIYNKHILVPFGEYIPIPCCKKFFNKIFFDGAEDYKASPTFVSYEIKGVKFLNAICYEATIEQLYKEKGKYIIAMSNDAWFVPSIETTLQKLLIEYYSLKYNKYVYHSRNL